MSMRRYILLFTLGFLVLAKPLESRAQWVVHDPVANIQHTLNQVSNYTSMLTNLTLLTRYGDLKALIGEFNTLVKEAKKVSNMVNEVRQVANGNTWAVPNLIREIGGDPTTVGLSRDVADIVNTAQRDSKQGISSWSIMRYDHDVAGMMKGLQAVREKEARQQAAENAVANTQRVSEAAKLVEGTAGKQTETQAHTTNQLLVQQLDVAAQESRMKAGEMQRQDAADMYRAIMKRGAMKTKVTVSLGGI